MQIDMRYAAIASVAASALCGCAVARAPVAPAANIAQAHAPAPQATVALAPMTGPAATSAPPAVPVPAVAASDAVLIYADRIRGMPPQELAQEVNRLGDPPDSPSLLMQLVFALNATRTAANGVRAQALLQRVLAMNSREAQALHPLARLLQLQHADARRMEEQLERQQQQVQTAQRRIEQLTDRLEAVRAIERSLPSRPAPAASGPVNGQRP